MKELKGVVVLATTFFGCHSHRYAYFGNRSHTLDPETNWFKAVPAIAILPTWGE